MYSLLDRLKPQHSVWPSVRETLRLCAKDRKKVIAERLRMSATAGKQLLIKVFNGGSVPASLAQNQFLKDLQKASYFCRWLACGLMTDASAYVLRDACRERPESSVLFYLWTVPEDKVLEVWLEKRAQALRP